MAASFQIGTLMGPEESTFGSIEDVDVDAEGRIHVFDRQGSSIRWFDRQGRYGGAAGRYGQGPGELKAPLAMDLDGHGRLHVLDAGNSRITTYERTEGGLSYAGDHRLDVYAEGICVAGQRRFLLTPRSELMFREIAADGTTVRMFGEPFDAEPALARQFPAGFPQSPLNGGQLLCDEARNLLVFMNALMGEVRAYTLDGERRTGSRAEPSSETRSSSRSPSTAGTALWTATTRPAFSVLGTGPTWASGTTG